MTRLEVLKAEKEQIKGLRCLSFGLIDKCIEWYDKEIEAIEEHGADNKFYGQQADDPYQTDMDEAWEQAKSELMQIYMSLSEEKKQAIDVAMDSIQKIQKIDYIINSPVSIQEDVFRYKMICEVIKE